MGRTRVYHWIVGKESNKRYKKGKNENEKKEITGIKLNNNNKKKILLTVTSNKNLYNFYTCTSILRHICILYTRICISSICCVYVRFVLLTPNDVHAIAATTSATVTKRSGLSET